VTVKAVTCPCCHPGMCGTPGCCPPPASAPTVFNAAQSVRRAGLTASRRAQAVRTVTAKFYVSIVEPVGVRTLLPASAKAAPPARVPLFKAHCSLLI
jgi:hypothetical protein